MLWYLSSDSLPSLGNVLCVVRYNTVSGETSAKLYCNRIMKWKMFVFHHNLSNGAISEIVFKCCTNKMHAALIYVWNFLDEEVWFKDYANM